MNTLLLFVSSFVVVFSIGLQTLMVTRFRYFGAFINSLVISFSQLLLFKLGPAAAGSEIAGYILGGPIGIICSMYAFHRWNKD